MRFLLIIVLFVHTAVLGSQLEEHNVAIGYSDTQELPFEMIKNTIIVPVVIDGVTYKFVLDTGGLFTISKRLQKDKQFEVVDYLDISDVNGNERSFERVKVGEISLGELNFNNREALVMSYNENYPNACYGTDGMIGRDFFDGMILQFDFNKGVIRLTNNVSVFDLKEQNKTKLRISDRGLPDVLLTINGKSEYIEFDSGSGDFFSYKSKQARKLRVKSSEDKLKFNGIFSFGVSSAEIKSTVRYRVKINSFKIGGIEFNNFYSNFSKPSAPRIGASILYYGRVTVDYKNLGFYFDPYPDKKEIIPFYTFGFDVVFLNDEYLVKWVLEDSNADREKLKFGYKIKAIDNTPIEDLMKACEGYINTPEFYNKERITLEYYDDQGALKKASLNRIQY
ncbi:MAG: aspartyl protease family protein [Bacteroidota bacterium]